VGAHRPAWLARSSRTYHMLARWCSPLVLRLRLAPRRGGAAAFLGNAAPTTPPPAAGPDPDPDLDPAALAASTALDAAWTRVAAAGRAGLADAESALEEAAGEAGAGGSTTARAALQDALAAVAFLRGARPAVAEAAAAAAVAAAAAACPPAPAALGRCRARHGATLVSLGRYADALAALQSGEPSPEAAFFTALAAVAGGAGGGAVAADLPPALVAAVITHPPPPAVAPLFEAAALRELRRAVDGAVGSGAWGRAVSLASAEVDGHAALAAARAAGERREDAAGGPPSPSQRPPPRPTDAALHAHYRLATLRFAIGGDAAAAVETAASAAAAADAAWGPDDDRAVLRAHRLAVARAAALVEGAGGDGATSAAGVEAAAARARDRFRQRLGRTAGLAGEAGVAAALARLVALRRSTAGGAGGGGDDAFTAVLLPRRRREAVAEAVEELRVMTAAYGPGHVLSVRLGGVVERAAGGT